MYFILLFVLLFFTTALQASDNFYDIEFSKDDIGNIKKHWVYNSRIYKDTQTKPIVYKDRIIYLDGQKNLIIISLTTGQEICRNTEKKDRGYHRGIGLYKKSLNEIYSVFVRHGELVLINIFDCKKKFFQKKLEFRFPVSAPILVNNNIAYVLFNGDAPHAYNLDNGNLIWKTKVPNNIKKKIINKKMKPKFNWDVWGGGVIDEKFNQIIFSTANAKPSFTIIGRKNQNLFYNSIVSIDLKNGNYKWHFQEIENDVLNLDLAAAPVLFDFHKENYVLQATKTGQLIILNRKNGEPISNFTTKSFNINSKKKKSVVKKKIFEDWQIYSKSNFLSDDINSLNEDFEFQSKKKISESIITEYTNLVNYKDYIYYGIHGGTQWPGIAVSNEGIAIIPSNNIAYVARLKDLSTFEYSKSLKKLFDSFANFKFEEIKNSLRKIKFSIDHLLSFYKIDIQSWKRFETVDGIPLNKPPWGTLTAIDIIKKKKLWQIPHGSYIKLKTLGISENTGSEIFGAPIITNGGVIFIAGTDDAKVRAYNIENGDKIWEENLPFSAYGNMIIAEYKNINYLIINSSGGSKFKSDKGDAIICYRLN